MENTKTFTTCNGKINSSGFCDKCFQMGAQTTTSLCGRLIEVEPSTSLPSEQKSLEDQIRKLENDEAIIDTILSKAPHYLYADSPMKMYLRPNVFSAMQEYADLQKKQLTEELQKKDAEYGALTGLVDTLEERLKATDEEVTMLRFANKTLLSQTVSDLEKRDK